MVMPEREVPGMRPEAGEFAVTAHAADEKGKRPQTDLLEHTDVRPLTQAVNGSEHGQRQ